MKNTTFTSDLTLLASYNNNHGRQKLSAVFSFLEHNLLFTVSG